MKDFFIQHQKDFLELAAFDQAEILKGLKEAIEKAFLVSIRGQEFNGEMVLCGVYMLTSEEAHRYQMNGGAWDYIDPGQLLEEFSKK